MSLDQMRRHLRELQDGRCGICGDHSDHLHLDHDHASGFVRGLLCNTCNLTEGRHGSCEIAQECPICTWRATPAVSWLGVTIRHSAPTIIAELHRGWVPANEIVDVSEQLNRRCAQIIQSRIGGAA